MSNQRIADGVLVKPVNVSELVFRALQTKGCTYHELNTCIGLEGALNIIEVDQAIKYNDARLRYVAEQEAKRNAG